MRPLCGPSGRRGPGSKQQRYKHRLPRGIYINHDDLVAMATGPQPGDPPQPGLVNQGEAMLKAMDREIISLKRQVRCNPPQIVSSIVLSNNTHSHSYIDTLLLIVIILNSEHGCVCVV